MDFFYDLNILDIRIFEKKSDKNMYYLNKSRYGDGFVYFFKGSGKITFSSKISYPISEGSFVRLNKGDYYYFEIDTPCEFFVTDMDITLSNADFYPRVTVLNDKLKELLTLAYLEWVKPNDGKFLSTRTALFGFFTEFLSYLKNSILVKTSNIDNAVLYVNKNYMINFTIEDVSKACNLSPSRLRQVFKQSTGKTLMDYREELRIKNAKIMLRSGEFSIKEVSDRLGYYDVYHFSKRFKKETGVTPGKFK